MAARLSATDKVMPREQALDQVARWRRQGLRIGFTNGCFDLLHAGHVALLPQAKMACDRLVVGGQQRRVGGAIEGPEPARPDAGGPGGGAGIVGGGRSDRDLR